MVELNCKRCGHHWKQRIMKKFPSKCPCCSNPNWNKESTNRDCKYCHKTFLTHMDQQHFCSKSCAKNWTLRSEEMLEYRRKWYLQDYKNNKQKYVDRAILWKNSNPEKARLLRKKCLDNFRKSKTEKFNKLMRRVYERNKDKYRARARLNYLLKRDNMGLIKKCKICNSIIDLEIHHESYPSHKKEIIQAIKNKKIYYLCRKCHKKLHYDISKSNKIIS